MKKKWKIGIGIGVALVILLCIFIGYKIGTYEYVPPKPIYEIKMYIDNKEIKSYPEIRYDYDGTIKGPEIKVFRNKTEIISTSLEEIVNMWHSQEYINSVVHARIDYTQTMNSETKYNVKPIERGLYFVNFEINGFTKWGNESLSGINIEKINTYCKIYIDYDSYYGGQN